MIKNKRKYEPLVSIVIPAYNAANYLAEAIESALAQTYQNIEVIVVNDGSSDSGATAEVAYSYKNRIRYIEKENGGSSSAMNAGINSMKGEWFSWLSHDDLYYPNKVEAQIDYINSLNIDFDDSDNLQKNILFASADLIDASGRIIKKFSRKAMEAADRKINRPNGELYLIAEPIQFGFHGCSCLIHKETFKQLGGFDEKLRLLNDMELWFRLYSNHYHIHYLPMVLVKGRVHAEQVSRKIGFSYHNDEQDVFWNSNLNWLLKNQSNNYELFYIYGKTAYKKTRYIEGDIAFRHLRDVGGFSPFKLEIEKLGLVCYARAKELLKYAYLKFVQ